MAKGSADDIKKPLRRAALCFALAGLVRRGTRGDRETPVRPGENCRAAKPQFVWLGLLINIRIGRAGTPRHEGGPGDADPTKRNSVAASLPLFVTTHNANAVPRIKYINNNSKLNKSW